MTRTGRRAGDSGTREAILGAARSAFSERGLDGATVRGIARRGGRRPGPRAALPRQQEPPLPGGHGAALQARRGHPHAPRRRSRARGRAPRALLRDRLGRRGQPERADRAAALGLHRPGRSGHDPRARRARGARPRWPRRSDGPTRSYARRSSARRCSASPCSATSSGSSRSPRPTPTPSRRPIGPSLQRYLTGDLSPQEDA